MEEAELRQRVREECDQNGEDLITTIPADSGICHIAAVSAGAWISGFVSDEPGRWNVSGDQKKYFANNFRTCAGELCGTETEKLKDCVFELWKTCQEIPALDISRFPEDLQSAFFEDKGAPPDKWTKPHILIEEAAKSPCLQNINSIFAPSASGQALGIGGMVFVTNMEGEQMKLVETGDYNSLFG